jgi:hypothetical protein
VRSSGHALGRWVCGLADDSHCSSAGGITLLCNPNRRLLDNHASANFTVRSSETQYTYAYTLDGGKPVSFVGDAKSSLGDAESSLGDAKSSLRDV